MLGEFNSNYSRVNKYIKKFNLSQKTAHNCQSIELPKYAVEHQERIEYSDDINWKFLKLSKIRWNDTQVQRQQHAKRQLADQLLCERNIIDVFQAVENIYVELR